MYDKTMANRVSRAPFTSPVVTDITTEIDFDMSCVLLPVVLGSSSIIAILYISIVIFF